MRARRATSARSPWGREGSCSLLATGGPQLCRCLGFFLLRSPDAFPGACEVDRDALDLFRDPVESLSQAQVAAETVGPPTLPHLLDQLLGVLSGAFGLLADQLLDLVVGHLDAELVGGGLEDELPRDRLTSLGAYGVAELLGRLARELQVGLHVEAAALERTEQSGEEVVGPRVDQGVGDAHVGRLGQAIDGSRPELGVELGLDQLAEP